MATITTLSNPQGLANAATPIFTSPAPYFISRDIDLAAAALAKGSALAAADIIEAVSVPAGHQVLNAGIKVVTAQVGATVMTLSVGITGVAVNNFVAAFDYFAATVGDFSQTPAAFYPLVVGKLADTVDVVITAQTGTNTAGIIRVWVAVQALDIGPRRGTLASRLG